MREAWKVLGEFMGKAGSGVSHFLHNPLAGPKFNPMVPCGNWEVKSSCVPRRERNLFGGHMAFSQLQCAMHRVNPHNNPVNGFLIPVFSPDEELKTYRSQTTY